MGTMIKTLSTFVLSLAITLGGATILAQDAQTPKQDEKKEEPNVTVIEPTKPAEITDVIVIVNTDDINRVLVVATDGRWIPDARGVTIKTAIGGKDAPTVECIMYQGLFKPTKPKVKNWKLTSIITASKADFQKILDGLEDGKFSLPGSEPAK